MVIGANGKIKKPKKKTKLTQLQKTLLALRAAHGPTLPPRVSPLAPHAQPIIKAVLLEITITGNHA